MGSLFGGLGGSPNTYSYGGSSRSYIPTGLTGADTSLQNYFSGLSVPASSYPQDNPNYTAYQTGLGLYGQAAPIANQYLINPGTTSQYQQGAQSAADYYANKVAPYYTAAPGNISGYANTVAGYAPTVAGYAPSVTSQASTLAPYTGSILNTAFDPQNALYNRNLGRTTAQDTALNAQGGLAGTPYGTSLTESALNNFNLDWENQQLQRQGYGLGVAGQNANTVGGLYNTAGGLYNTAGGLYNTAANLDTAGLNLGGSLASGMNWAGSLPYNAGVTIGNNALSTISGLNQMIGNVGQTGAGSYSLSQSQIADLLAYLNAGNQATSTGLQGGQQGYNQGMSSLLGLGSLVGLGIGTGGFGLGGLLGGGASAAVDPYYLNSLPYFSTY